METNQRPRNPGLHSVGLAAFDVVCDLLRQGVFFRSDHLPTMPSRLQGQVFHDLQIPDHGLEC